MVGSDHSRLLFSRMMKEEGVDQLGYKYFDFVLFLSDPLNGYYLQLYYLLLSGYMNEQDVLERGRELLDEFSYEGCSYRYLFSLDFGWYEYYKENAWASGLRRLRESRRGVCKEEVMRIMRIKRGPPELDLESAISGYCSTKC